MDYITDRNVLFGLVILLALLFLALALIVDDLNARIRNLESGGPVVLITPAQVRRNWWGKWVRTNDTKTSESN